MLAAIVDVDALLKVVAAAFIAGVGATAMFSVVIFSATRAAELRRGGARALPALLAVVALAGLLACIGGVALALQIMTTKS